MTAGPLPPGSFAERLSGTSEQAQALYRAVLPAFAATGAPPPLSAAAEQAGLSTAQAAAVLRELAEADVVALDDTGRLVGAFPLSATPTRHLVQVGDRPVLHAMCAIDALGVPAMLGAPGVITSTDPLDDRPVTVVVDGDGRLTADPPDVVVLLGASGDGGLADSACPVIDFYADAENAHQALAQPGLTGDVLALADAHALGVALFADLPAAPRRSA